MVVSDVAVPVADSATRLPDVVCDPQLVSMSANATAATVMPQGPR